jgi:4-diphosphocytidyl-2-C-methyl-D-erythritol kinase
VNSNFVTAIVRSYAKVNLTLDVLDRRADGYHAVESIMQSISLHDTISVRRRNGSGIRVTCDMPGIPADMRNLAHKAAHLLLANKGIEVGLDIHIGKRIPIKAGLGGGSSNAAAVLSCLNEYLGLDMSLEALIDLGAQVGSDVPFFMVGGTAFVCGRGEEVRSLPDIRTRWLVIIKPQFGVSTEWAYRRLDETRLSEPGSRSMRMLECMEEKKCTHLPQLLGNDLEPPAFEQHPELTKIKCSLLQAGALGALMCGSGSAVFGLFDSEENALAAADRLSRLDGRLFVERTLTRGESIGAEV